MSVWHFWSLAKFSPTQLGDVSTLLSRIKTSICVESETHTSVCNRAMKREAKTGVEEEVKWGKTKRLKWCRSKSRKEGEGGRGTGTENDAESGAVTWLSGSGQGLDVPQSPPTKFGQNWDYSGGEKKKKLEWLQSVLLCVCRTPSLSLLISFFLFSHSLPYSLFLSSSSSHRQSNGRSLFFSILGRVTLKHRVACIFGHNRTGTYIYI